MTKRELEELVQKQNAKTAGLNNENQSPPHTEDLEKTFSELTDLFALLTADPSTNIDIIVRKTCELLNGACSLYNRLDDRKKSLITWSDYKSPPDLQREDKPEGHICYEATIKGKDQPVIIEDLKGSVYEKSDPSVKKYQLRSYLGYPVHLNGTAVGSLCIVDTKPRSFSAVELKLLIALAKALSLEEARKDADNRVKGSEENFRNIFNNTSDGIFIHDKDSGAVLEVNKRACEMYDCSMEDKASLELADTGIVEEGFTSELARSKFSDVLQKGPQSFQWHARTLRGNPFWVQVDLKLETIGGKQRILGIQRDIDEHVLSDLALEESRRMLRLIIDTIPVRVFWKDREFRYLGCNLPFANDAGFSDPEQLVGRNDYECAWAKEAELYRADDNYVISTGNSKIAYEEPQTNKKGQVLWLRTSKIPLRDGDGHIIGILGTYEIITEKKLAEQALRESEEKYRNLIQHSSDAIYLLYNRKFELINDKFQEMFGLTLEDVNSPDFDFMDLVAPSSRPMIEERMKRFAAGEKIKLKYEFNARTRMGTELEVETSVSHIKYKDGIATQGIIRDVTERKKLEEQVRHTQKIEAVGRLAGGVAHDFNNLLTVINGYCELLLHRDLPENVHDKIDQIYQAGIKAGRLTSQLLAFSRKQVIQPRVLKLNSVISEMHKMLHRLLGEDIEIETVLNPELELIKADPGQLEQIIINLAVNARDAMPTGGKLTIESDNVQLDEQFTVKHIGSRTGYYVVLSIRDTGIGMDAEVKSHIFEPFFTTKERGKGTGLGLSTVYGIVKQNDGYISVESDAGEGTEFRLYFPVVSGQKKSAKRDTSHKRALEGYETILLVEDDPGVRELTFSVLSRYGYNVLNAGDGREALEMAENYENRIHLLLTDVIMPKMSGKELATILSKKISDLKIIFFSGYTDDGIAQHGVLDNDTQFIQKPFSQSGLVEKIRNVLDSGN